LKKNYLHAYGFQEVFLLRNLEKLKILKKQEGRNNYDSINESLKLIKEDVNISSPNDASYVFGGFCPITIRLIENLIKIGWNPLKEILKKLPGDFEIPANEKEIISPRNKPNFILLVFVGGITFAEISAIRFLNKNSSLHKFFILTTHIINGRNFMNTSRVQFNQVLNFKEFYSQLKEMENKK